MAGEGSKEAEIAGWQTRRVCIGQTSERVSGFRHAFASQEMDTARSDDTLTIPAPACLVYKPNNLTGHEGSIIFVLLSAPPALMATFTASSIGSLKGTSIRSRPCS